MKLAIKDNSGAIKMVELSQASDKIKNAVKDSNPVPTPPSALPEVEFINDNPYIDSYCFFCGQDDKSAHLLTCMYSKAATILSAAVMDTKTK